MISQTDATLSPATTTTHNVTSNHHQALSSSTILHNGKSSKGFNVKKRKKFEETIIDGFSIIAFKTWEDLQDELNERGSLTNINNSNTTNSTNNFDTNCTADKKTNPKGLKQKSSSTSSSTSAISDSTSPSNFPSKNSATSTTTTSPKSKEPISKKTKDKAKKVSSQSQGKVDKPSKDKVRNRTDKCTLKKALEAKELAEKRLSILQEKLKHEQSKNRNNNSHGVANEQSASPINAEHFPSSQTPTHVTINNEEIHTPNGLSQDLLKDPINSVPKAMPYSPFHINSNLHRPNPMIHQPIQIQSPPSPTRSIQSQHQKHSAQNLQHQSHHSPSPSIPPPSSTNHLLQQTPPPLTQIHQTQSHFRRLPQLSTPQGQPPPPPPPHPHLLQHPIQSPSLHPYHHQSPSSMIPSMGLGTIPSPYSCPPSIYITDTISRQTSIIPPSLGPATLESQAQAAQSNRFGHSSVLHSISPYSPALPHHPMYYPTLPTERSFIEFARSYTGPGNLGYPSLMNTFPTPSPSITANPYTFERWPRVALDHQRAVSRYNSLYQSTTSLPDRTYASYSSSRPPSFPAGLFVSIGSL